MALAANAALAAAMPEDLSEIVKNAAELYDNAIVAIEAATGKLKPYAAASGEIPVGIHVGRKTGVAAGTVEGVVDGRAKRLPKVTVTGAAAQTDVGKTVYRASDDPNALTLTYGGLPFGIVTYWYSGTTCDVVQFSGREFALEALAGGNAKTLEIPIAPVVEGAYMVGASGPPITGLLLRGHGLLVSHKAFCVRAPTDADFSITVQPKINDVATTGGLVALLHGDAVAAIKAGTAITGANEFHDGDTLQLYSANVAGAVTATDPGLYIAQIDIRYLPGL